MRGSQPLTGLGEIKLWSQVVAPASCGYILLQLQDLCCALTYDMNIEENKTVVLLLNGKLILSLDKDTYGFKMADWKHFMHASST